MAEEDLIPLDIVTNGTPEKETAIAQSFQQGNYKANPTQFTYDQPHQQDFVIEVVDAYFKKKRIQWISKQDTYAVNASGTLSSVLNLKKKELEANKTKYRNLSGKPANDKEKKTYTKGDQIIRTWEEETLVYERVDQADVGDTLLLYVQCTGNTGKLKIEIYETLQLAEKMIFTNPVDFLIEGKGKIAHEFTIDGSQYYTQEITLRPEDSSEFTKVRENLKQINLHSTFLYLKVSVLDTRDEIIWLGGVSIQQPNTKYNPVGEYLLGKRKFEVQLRKTCPIDPAYRSHFVLHCTAGKMAEASIKAHTKLDTPNKTRSKAHKYIMPDGKIIEIWPFTEKNVWATKAESRNNLKGQMFHVEINYGPPSTPSEAQYQALADLYIEAADIEGCWPIIVPHIEIDRGIPDGHGDPTDFDYNKFYEILRNKDVPIDDIPHFDHDRYWGKPTYKVPWGNDKNSWPPILKGDPHKK